MPSRPMRIEILVFKQSLLRAGYCIARAPRHDQEGICWVNTCVSATVCVLATDPCSRLVCFLYNKQDTQDEYFPSFEGEKWFCKAQHGPFYLYGIDTMGLLLCNGIISACHSPSVHLSLPAQVPCGEAPRCYSRQPRRIRSRRAAGASLIAEGVYLADHLRYIRA